MHSVTVLYKVRARKGCRPGFVLSFHGTPPATVQARPIAVYGGPVPANKILPARAIRDRFRRVVRENGRPDSFGPLAPVGVPAWHYGRGIR